MTSPLSIAQKLTKAQARAMVRRYRYGDPTALYPGDPSVRTLAVCARLGLLAGPPYARDQRYTPLGLEVRAILQQESSHDR